MQETEEVGGCEKTPARFSELPTRTMRIVSVEDVQQHVTEYLYTAEAGETIIITRHNLPVLELKQVAPPGVRLRPFGLCAGEFRTPDDFDAPLPEAIVNDFEGV